MDAEALGSYIDAHIANPGDRLFRLEALPTYAVESDGEDYQRWLDGAPEPVWERKQPWLDTLRRERDNQQTSTRVRILSAQVTEYEQYSCAFGYTYNAEAGEDIRVLRRGEHAFPAGLIERDFWLINDEIVVQMHYDDLGSFEGAELGDPSALADHMRTRNSAWAAAEPFASWWARHRELHRAPVA